MSNSKKLTAKQARFIEEYMVDLNATQAAIRAGYSEKTGKDIGCQNLAKPNIASEIAKRRAKVSDKVGMTAEKLRAENAKLAFSSVLDFYKVSGQEMILKSPSDISEDAWAAVSEITVINLPDGSGQGIKLKMHSKPKAIELGHKEQGMLVEKVETAGELKISITQYGSNKRNKG